MGLYLGQSVYNDGEVTEEFVREQIEANGKGVFFAVVGTTSYNDVLAAYNDGKIVLAVEHNDEQGHATFYPLTTFDPDPDEGDEFTFMRDLDNTFEYYNLHIRGGWSYRYYKNIITVDSQLDPTSHNPVENMAIAAEITAINDKITGDLNDIFLALASKGVTVPAGAGLDDVAGLIEDVPTGGGAVVPPDPTLYKTYLYFERNTSVTIRCHEYRYDNDFSIETSDIIEASLYFTNALLESSLSGVADIGNSNFCTPFKCGTGVNDNDRNGRYVTFGYGPDRWSSSFEPSSYHLRCFATNFQNGGYYYGKAAVIYIGDIAAGTMLNIRQTDEYLEVNGTRQNYSNPQSSFSEFSTNNWNLPYLSALADPLGLRVYEIRVYKKDGTPKYRLVPCIRLANNAPGYYDCYSGKFYYNTEWASNMPTLGPEMPV